MKKLVFGVMVCAALGVGIWLAQPQRSTEADALAQAVKQAHPGELAVKTDPVEIFKKVLWRAPQPDDKILHAERREWTEGGAVQNWQWFLHVDAGKDLNDYLRVANAFGLHSAEAADVKIANAPDWFPADFTDYDILRTGGMTFLFRKGSNEFHATSQGKGFTKAIPTQPVKPVTTPQPQGRIPTTPPPNPE